MNVGFGLSTLDIAPQWIAAFRRLHLDIDITLNDYSSAEQTRRLLSGVLDVGFIRMPADTGLEALPLLDEQLGLAVPNGSDWYAVPCDLSELNETGFIALTRSRGPGLTDQIANWCSVRRFKPRVIQQADDIQTVLAAVSAGIGVALLPLRSERLFRQGVRMLRLDDPAARWRVGAAWLPAREHPVVDRFVALLRRADCMATGDLDTMEGVSESKLPEVKRGF